MVRTRHSFHAQTFGEAVCFGGHLEIEARIVDEYQYIGACAAQRLLGGVQIGGNASQVAQYLAEAHECHVAIVYYRRDAADGTHALAAEIYKFGCRVVAA